MQRFPWVALWVLAACGTRPVEETRPVDDGPLFPPLEAAPPSTPLNDPTADDPPREPGGENIPFPPGAATTGDGLQDLEEAHQEGREEVDGHAFIIRRLGGEADARRLVHCSTARVITQGSAGSDRLSTTARELGLPPEGWFVALDPTGQLKGALDLPWYRHLARYHRLNHLGTAGGIEYYRYVGPRPPLGE